MSKAIVVKHLPHTGTRPSRYKASDLDGNSVTISSSSTTTDYPEQEAAQALCAKMNWSGSLAGGETKRDHVFVFVPHLDNFKAAATAILDWMEASDLTHTTDLNGKMRVGRTEYSVVTDLRRALLDDSTLQLVARPNDDAPTAPPLPSITAKDLKETFPWLGTDKDAGSGDDIIDELCGLYQSLKPKRPRKAKKPPKQLRCPNCKDGIVFLRVLEDTVVNRPVLSYANSRIKAGAITNYQNEESEHAARLECDCGHEFPIPDGVQVVYA